ncbi:MAG: ComEC/Rec2 family competence protein [Bacteroidales bacterium]|nr:ComEC/Rec2 family competence protein [Bacteroidales bacterium]
MFEKFLHQTPFIKFVLPFILGIIFKINFSKIDISFIIIFFVLLTLIFVLKLLNHAQNYLNNRFWSVLIFLAIFVSGAQLVQEKQKRVFYFSNKEYTVIATVAENPVEKEKSYKAILNISALKDSTKWINPKTKFIAYFQKDSNSQSLSIGDQIITKSILVPVKHSGNPYTFNYKNYLKYKEIYYQAFIKTNQFKLINHNCGSKLKIFSNQLRNKLLNIYKTNNITGDEFAVLSALTLGFKADLTPELKESFSTSGAMHVLAVSGLHVGIIFIILSKLLFFLERFKYGKIVQAVIIILILGFYACLTGLSNSVIRSTIMFTFICIGRVFTRQVNIYNTLCASAFIMLLYNPYSIMDVGFQLSYLAVISIVFFQPKIYSLLSPKLKITDYIWQLITVAIAAQIATFPITIHYFEQFPVYFILSNIIIIPIVSIIIYGAILLFCFSFSSNIAIYIAKILNFFTFILNKNVELIESLPFSKFDSLIIDNSEILILISTVLFFSFFILKKQIRFIKYSFLTLIFFIIYNISIPIVNSNKSMLIIYNIPKYSALNLINGNYSHLYTDIEKQNSENTIKYNILPLWRRLGIKRFFSADLANTNNFFEYYTINNTRIINIRNSSIRKFKSKHKLKSDYLILSQNANIKINELKKFFDFNTLIFDSSNSNYKIRIWENECKLENVKYYSIPDQGAFNIQL